MEDNSTSVSSAAFAIDLNTVPNPTIHDVLSVDDTSADDKTVPTRNVSAIRYGLDPTRHISSTDTVNIQTMEELQCQKMVHYPKPTELSVSIPTGVKLTATILPVSRSSTIDKSSIADYKKDITQHNVITSPDNEMASQFNIVTQRSEYYPSQLAHTASTLILPKQSARETFGMSNSVVTGSVEESHSTDKRNIVNKADNATNIVNKADNATNIVNKADNATNIVNKADNATNIVNKADNATKITGGGVTYCYPAAKCTARIVKVKHELPVKLSEKTILPVVSHSYPVPGNSAVHAHPLVKTTIGITVSHNNQTTPRDTTPRDASVAHMPTGTTYKSGFPNREEIKKHISIQTSVNVPPPANGKATKPKYTITNKPLVSPSNCNPSSESSGNTAIGTSLMTTSQSTTSVMQSMKHVISSTSNKPQSMLSAMQPTANNIPPAVQLTSHNIPSVEQLPSVVQIPSHSIPMSLDIPSATQLTSTTITAKGMLHTIRSTPSAVKFASQSLSFVEQPTSTSHSVKSAVQHVSQSRSSSVEIMLTEKPLKNRQHSKPSTVQNIAQGIMSTKQSMPQIIPSNTPLIKTSREIENLVPTVSLHRYVNSKGVIFPIYNRKRPDLQAKFAKDIGRLIEKDSSLPSKTTTAYPIFAKSNESSDKRQWSTYFKVGDVSVKNVPSHTTLSGNTEGICKDVDEDVNKSSSDTDNFKVCDVSVMDDVCEVEKVPSHGTLSSDTEGICRDFDEDLNKSASDTDKPVLLPSKKMLSNSESLRKSCQKKTRPRYEKKMNLLQPHEQGGVDKLWYSQMSELLKKYGTNKTTVPEYVTLHNERYVINCLDSHTDDNDPEYTGYENSKLPGLRECDEDIQDGSGLIKEIVNLKENNIHRNSRVGVKCSSDIGNKRKSTTHVVPFASTDSTNAGGFSDLDPHCNFPNRVVDSVEPNLIQEMADNDMITPVLLIPNVHCVSSQHECNEVNDSSGSLKVGSYLGDPLTINTGTENIIPKHDRVQCEKFRLDNITVACTQSVTQIPSLSKQVSSSPVVKLNVKSRHVDTMSSYAVTQEMVSVIKQEKETEMLNSASDLETTQFISPPEVKIESMVHDSHGEPGSRFLVEPIYNDNRNISDECLPIFKIKEEPLDIYTSNNENGCATAQHLSVEGENHAIKIEPPDSTCSGFPSDIEHTDIIDFSTQPPDSCVREIQTRQQDILRTNDTDHKTDRLSECSKIDSEIQEQTKEKLRYHLKRKAVTVSSNTNAISFSQSSTSGTSANKDGCVSRSKYYKACITPTIRQHSYSIQPSQNSTTYHNCSTLSSNNVSSPKRNEHCPYDLKKNNTDLSRNTSTSLSSSNNDSLVTDNKLNAKKEECQSKSWTPLYKCNRKKHTISVDKRLISSNIHAGSDLGVKSSDVVSLKSVKCRTDTGDNRPTSSNIHVGSEHNVETSDDVSSRSVECQTDTGERGWISLL